MPTVLLLLVFAADADGLRFFETRVRPVLAEHCLKCHGPDKQRGGLRVDSLAAMLRGGESGPAVVPRKPAESALLKAVRHEGGLDMPPGGKKIPPPQIAILEEWVKRGAPAPDSASGVRPKGVITDEDRRWWAFVPVVAPPAPAGAAHPVDAFVDAALRAKKLTAAPEADRRALIRRLTFDLHGLPPTPDEVAAFVADARVDAYERLVDRLLASPRYGQRWARHWLDLVRYADSDGYRLDEYRPTAWRYRDYVVSSLNADKPYDRFVREQIAGDELYPGDVEARIATGYLRHTIYEYNARDVRGQWDTILNDLTDTTGDVFLAMGLQCARCHDHKFDPILRKDYYRLRAFLAPVLPRDDLPAVGEGEVERHRRARAAYDAKTATIRAELAAVEAPYRAKAIREAVEKFPPDIQEMIRKPASERSPLEHQLAELAYRQVTYELDRIAGKLKGADKEKADAIRKRLAAFDRDKPAPLPTAFAVSDASPTAPVVSMPKREGEDVAPGVPSVIDDRASVIPRVSPNSTGRRAALAGWIASADNPLTARVMVNRVWQYHFGRGLAANSSDFGKLGEKPTHPELLDFLAARFVREGWSLKRLHRLVLTSAAYRRSSAHPDGEACRLIDPENRLYARAGVRRLDAEQIRDAMLYVSGELANDAGGPGALPTGVRRTVYSRMMRNSRDPLLDVFDLPQFFASASSRDTTTTAVQSLMLVNGKAVLSRAEAFAARVTREATTDGERVTRVWMLAYGRKPDEGERLAAMSFLREQARRAKEGGRGAMADLCQAVMNASEFMYAE